MCHVLIHFETEFLLLLNSQVYQKITASFIMISRYLQPKILFKRNVHFFVQFKEKSYFQVFACRKEQHSSLHLSLSLCHWVTLGVRWHHTDVCPFPTSQRNTLKL